MVIFPSAGHHLKDPGAVYNGRQENKEMILFRDWVIEHLNAKNHKNIPDNDHETAAEHQARIKPGDGSVVCEFHLNASTNTMANGTEVIVKNNANKISISLATEIAEVTAKILGIRNRGVKTESQTARRRIGILNQPGVAILVEICFLSNKNDMAAYDKNRKELAKIYAGILIKYDNLK